MFEPGDLITPAGRHQTLIDVEPNDCKPSIRTRIVPDVFVLFLGKDHQFFRKTQEYVYRLFVLYDQKVWYTMSWYDKEALFKKWKSALQVEEDGL